MLRQNKWNEEKLEELLQQMPKIVDNRNPQFVYQRLSSKLKKRKQRTWFVPTFAAILALLLIVILLPGMFPSNDVALDNNASQPEMQEKILMEETADFDSEGAEQADMDKTASDVQTENDQYINMLNNEFATEALTAVYEQDLTNNDWTFFAIPDQQVQNLVPVTVLIAKDDTSSWFDSFSYVGGKLTELAWGLNDYFPLNGKMTYEDADKTIHIDLPSDHTYGQGSAGYTTFVQTLHETFSSEEKTVNKVILSTEQVAGMAGHDDFLEELTVEKATNRGYFLFYPIKGEKPFIVPSPTTSDNIESAIREMEQPIPTHELISPIPEHVKIDHVAGNNNVLSVYFSDDTQLIDNAPMIYFTEAILLTAKEFGYEMVKFENPTTEKIGPFQLIQPIRVPIAANKRVIDN